MDSRPILNNEISLQDFEEFYWLKSELIGFCKAQQLKATGAKLELVSRISTYLKTGEKHSKNESKQLKPTSTFDWKMAELSPVTVITDNYRNTENVREFFISQIGPQFKFNVKFMNWMKSNSGKTLEDAVKQWSAIKLASKTLDGPKVIAPQFEYNRYLRDFMADNPSMTRMDGIKSWNFKRKRRGKPVYNKKDLNY